MFNDVSYVESPVYLRRSVVVGRPVQLSCNTSLTSDTMWTYDNDNDGYVDYVYWNGRIAGDWPRLFIRSITDHLHNLGITDAELNDTGLYDCYDGTGMRKVGYQLIIAGMSSSCIL